MSRIYHEGQRELQRQFDTCVSPIVSSRSPVERASRLRIAPSLSRATCSFSRPPTPRGARTVRTRAAIRGSCECIDETTIAFPNYDGNGMFLSFGNATVNPHVGLLFIDFESPKRLRLNGEAAIDPRGPFVSRSRKRNSSFG